jgi:ATP-binding cassette subfamily B multidrug efflux pump
MKSYFSSQKWYIFIVTVTGIIYNIGVVAGPWFEGRLALCFVNILKGKDTPQRMVRIAVFYVLTILAVQAMRFVKRLYVRKFANNIRLDMRDTLYKSLVHMDRAAMERERAGEVMTKAITDVDACAEGMRKFLTEIFDTGVAMAAYLVMLFYYDVRLTLIAMIFPPIAYLIAEKMKRVVTRSTAESRRSAERLAGATLDRVSNAVTYRVYGREKDQDRTYETYLSDYEKKAVRANIWENMMQPIYLVIAMAGTIFVIWLGGRNVLGTGWRVWTIASFTTYLSCYTKLSQKTSHAAKLFNALQKASVSWKRIRPFMKDTPDTPDAGAAEPADLVFENVSFAYPDEEGEPDGPAAEESSGTPVYSGLTFAAHPGELIGVTGGVASGKSTLGKTFLCEEPYGGSIRYGGAELADIVSPERAAVVGYMGHDPELFSDTIEENIRLGKEGDILPYIRAVCLDEEIRSFPDGLATQIGDGGVRLSGGQQARVALARTLFHNRPVMVLDDPFSAVDRPTERKILSNIKAMQRDAIIFLISHRLETFDETDQVIWMEEGHVTVSTHDALLQENETYRRLCTLQSETEPSGEETPHENR